MTRQNWSRAQREIASKRIISENRLARADYGESVNCEACYNLMRRGTPMLKVNAKGVA